MLSEVINLIRNAIVIKTSSKTQGLIFRKFALRKAFGIALSSVFSKSDDFFIAEKLLFLWLRSLLYLDHVLKKKEFYT